MRESEKRERRGKEEEQSVFCVSLSLLDFFVVFFSMTSSSSFESCLKSLFRTSSPLENDDRHEETKKSKNAKNEKRVREIDKFHANAMLPNNKTLR